MQCHQPYIAQHAAWADKYVKRCNKIKASKKVVYKIESCFRSVRGEFLLIIMNVSPYLPHAAAKKTRLFSKVSLVPKAKTSRANVLVVSCGSVSQPFSSFQPSPLATKRKQNSGNFPTKNESLIMQEINTSSNIEKRLEQEKTTPDISSNSSKDRECADSVFPIKRQRRCPRTIFD